jgi:hypothetical protein
LMGCGASATRIRVAASTVDTWARNGDNEAWGPAVGQATPRDSGGEGAAEHAAGGVMLSGGGARGGRGRGLQSLVLGMQVATKRALLERRQHARWRGQQLAVSQWKRISGVVSGGVRVRFTLSQARALAGLPRTGIGLVMCTGARSCYRRALSDVVRARSYHVLASPAQAGCWRPWEQAPSWSLSSRGSGRSALGISSGAGAGHGSPRGHRAARTTMVRGLLMRGGGSRGGAGAAASRCGYGR